jgi:hypothetical protein
VARAVPPKPTAAASASLVPRSSHRPASRRPAWASSFAGIQNDNYTVSNDVGTFNIAGTNLANFTFKAPPPAPISLPPVHDSVPILGSYTAYPHIPNLTLTWGDWTGGDSGVTVNAQLSGEIDVHITLGPVNPKLTLTNLPVTITFGTDSSGNATVSPSQVVVAPVGSHGSVHDCGFGDWCDGAVSGRIESSVQSQLQSTLASQFNSALNGQNNSSPFWRGFMSTLANQAVLSVLSDPAGYPLPKVNQATPAEPRPPGRSRIPAGSATPVAR